MRDYFIHSIPIAHHAQKINIGIDWPSWLTAIGTVALAAIAIWPQLKSWLVGPRLKIALDQSIGFVVSSDLKLHKLQLGINFINPGARAYTIHKVVLKLFRKSFDWNLFIKDYQGKLVLPDVRPTSFFLEGNKSGYKMIQFYSEDDIKPGELRNGKHNVELQI